MIMVPSTLEEAIDETINILSSENILLEVYNSDEDEFIREYNYNFLGEHIRSHWGLWEKKGNLYKLFYNMDLILSEDISNVILRSTWRKMQCYPYNIENQINVCKKFWQYHELESE